MTATPKKKRGRPRKYDYVTLTVKYKLPVGAFAPDLYDGVDYAVERLATSFDAESVSIEVNGKRVRFR